MPEDLRAQARSHRLSLMRRLPDGVILLQAALPARRNGDVEFPYRQDSSFLWLTGVARPGHALLLDARRREEWLFCPRPTQKHAVWIGSIPSLDEARRLYGVAHTAYRDELEKALAHLRRRAGELHAAA